jgi:hypothetical protein
MSRYTPPHLVLPIRAMICALLTAFICCLNALAVIAQEDAAFKNITAHLAESLTEEEDLSELTERLSFYKRNPLDLNHATAEQLKELVFLSALQIGNLHRHIQLNGKLKDILELQGIEEFDQETIRSLIPYVTVKAEPGFKNLDLKSLLKDGNNELILRYGQVLKQQKGFDHLPGSRYTGSPQKILLKYKYSLGDLLSLSLTGDKDAGERFFAGNSPSGFDFLSGSLGLYKNGPFSKIVIGDYSLQFGQGLTLWTGNSFGKGTDVAGVVKKDTGLKPYTSANEFSFFRGLGANVNILNITSFTPFISWRNLDASLGSSTPSDAGEISEDASTLSTISKSGLHRTPTELNNKGSLQQLVYGTVFQFKITNLESGIITYRSIYDHEFSRGNAVYRRYAFEGKKLSNFGIYYNYSFKSIYLFGETARSVPGGFALLHGAMTSISRSLSALILYRNYAKDHHTFYSQGIGAGSSAANERGWYAGLHWSRRRHWDLSIYADIYHFPWAKYRIDSASSGNDLLGQFSYSPHKNLKMVLKVNLRWSEQNKNDELPVHSLAAVQKKNYRLSANWQLNIRMRMENRIEITQYRKGDVSATYGYMIFQDADYSPLSSRLSGNIRLAFFNTASYDNRIYAYEDDVLYGSGSALYNGRGFRSLVNVNYRLTHKLKIWARYATFYYPGQELTGSGLDEIKGSSKPEIRLQLRYQF